METPSEDILRQGQYEIYRDIILGSGSYGKVYSGFDTQKKRRVAVKEVHKLSDRAKREVNNLMNLKEHDNVVRIYDSFIYAESLWIVMQFCSGPTLDRYMEKDNPEICVKLKIAEQFSDALSYMCMVSPPIAHRDLKPLNTIMVNGHHVKICDYGLSKAIDPDSTMHAATTACSRHYMAPELIGWNLNYDPFKVDIFSLGLIILAMLTFTPGQIMEHFFHPDCGGERMRLDGHDGALQEKLASLQSPCRKTSRIISLVRRMLNYTPTDRPDIHQVLDEILKIQKMESMDAQDGGAQGGVDVRSGNRREGVPSGVMPSLQITSQHDLGFDAHRRVGFSCSNHVLLCDKSPHPHLHLYKHDDRGYSRVCNKPLPTGMKSYCRKALLSSSHILLQRSFNSVTVRYGTNNIQPQGTFQRPGDFIDCLPGGQVVYGRGTWRKEGVKIVYDKDWLVDVYASLGEQRPVTLQPPEGTGWERRLSVCSVRDHIAVTETDSRSFDLFTTIGEHVLHIELPYRPAQIHAITANGDILFVAEFCRPVVIHVLTMHGEEVGVIRHEELGLKKDDRVWGIRCCQGLLNMCVGNFHRETVSGAITSIRAYRVSGTM